MNTRSGRLLSFALIGAAAIVLAFPGPAAAQLSDQNKFRASVRISGGAGFTLNGGGDLELERLGIADYFSDIATLSGYSVSQNWKKMSLVPDVEIDFLFNLTDRFQFGIGTGYVRATSKGDYSYDYAEEGSVSWGSYTYSDAIAYARDYLLTAIPIRLTLFTTMPMGQKLNIYAYAGGAFYLGSLKHNYTMDESFFYEDFSSTYLDEKYEVTAAARGTETAKNNALGFHGGLGVEYKLFQNISLGFEVFGRYVNFGNWDSVLDETDSTRTRAYLEGSGWYSDVTEDDTYSENGPIWYYKYLDSDFGKNYAYMQTFSEEPAGDSISAVRKAKLNLNTFGIRLTLKFYFNVN
jgi:opacity protein-like surface antigen